VVYGVSAHVLDRVLASPNVAQVLRALPPWMRPEVDATRRAIRRAAREYEALPSSGDGNAEAVPAEVGPALPHEITTYEASVLLAISERRVRQLAAEGMGRQVAGRWLLDRSAVLAYAGRRRSA
jgi:hypothetical protein